MIKIKNVRLKKILLSLMLVLVLGTSSYASFTVNAISPNDYENDVLFYLDLVEQYKENNANTDEKEINNMLRKAIKKYNTYFINKQSKLVKNQMDFDYTKILPPTQASKLGDNEKEVFNSNPWKGLLVLASAQDAIKMSELLYTWNGAWNVVNGNMDAFRHFYWNLSGSLGTDDTEYMKRFADAHEDRPHVLIRERDMDYVNNRFGRNYYIEHRSELKGNYSIGEEWLAYKIRNEVVRPGGLVRFSGDNFDIPVFCGTDSLGEK